MARSLEPVPMKQSETLMSRLMTPEGANVYGNVHGGIIMKYIDETAAVAAWRHARVQKVVTASIDRMDFREPVFIGDILHIRATVRHTGRSSMLVGVRVEAEEPATGEIRHTGRCYLTFVALDKNNKPMRVPPVVAENEAEQDRMDRARRVHEALKATRNEEK